MTAAAFVEIELKFICSKLNFLHFKPFTSRTVRFRDVYFDRVSPAMAPQSLAAKDVWLRMRDDRWQLKVPHIAHDHKNSSIRTYEELETESAIAVCVADRLNVTVPMAKTHHSLENWLAFNAGVERLTPFDTVRRSCVLPSDPRFRIDLDYCPQLDYSIGEVEIVAPNTSHADLLAFCGLNSIDVTSSPPPGKIVVLLQRFYPALYRQTLSHS
jgi:hypothetical protein